MGKVVYREFLGNRLLLFLLWVSGIGIPLAILYMMEWTVTVEEEMQDPGAFMDKFRNRRG